MASLDWLGVLNQLKSLQLAYDRAGLVDEAAFPPGAVGCWEVACRPPPLLHIWRAGFEPDCLNAGLCTAGCGARLSPQGKAVLICHPRLHPQAGLEALVLRPVSVWASLRTVPPGLATVAALTTLQVIPVADRMNARSMSGCLSFLGRCKYPCSWANHVSFKGSILLVTPNPPKMLNCGCPLVPPPFHGAAGSSRHG